MALGTSPESKPIVAGLGSPLAALLILVGLKTMIDLIAHGLERRKFSEAAHA